LILVLWPVSCRAIPFYRPEQINAEGPTYAFFSHHKCGTILNKGIAEDMAKKMGMPFVHVNWFQVESAKCVPNAVMFFEDIRVPVLNRLLKSCPRLRGIHLVRDLPHAVASNYAYTRALKPGHDIASDVQRGAMLRSLPLGEGVQMECNIFLKTYGPQMVDVHQHIIDHSLHNIKEVPFEQFSTDYDTVTQSMFMHFLGDSPHRIRNLVKYVKRHDISGWDERELDHHNQISDHVSSDDVKGDARDILNDMYVDGEPCSQQLHELNHKLGYSRR